MSKINGKRLREDKIMAVLNRQVPVDGLDALMYAYRPEPRIVDLSLTALALDSSAFLRLGNHPDIIDYLNARHPAPIILPGQSIQEFWNNNLVVADSIATGIGKKFKELKGEIDKVDSNFQDFESRFDALLGEFKDSFGYAYDGITVRRTMSLFEVLKTKATISYVTRDRFLSLANHRKRTKTPPGFKDDSDGDFFVWLDMLDALLLSRGRKMEFQHVALITLDKKPDWSREGIAHPLLSAEIHALLGVTFETWDIPRLAREVTALSG